jgi:hypothetical protein
MSESSATCSVIIPTRNRAALTLRAADSALASVSINEPEVIGHCLLDCRHSRSARRYLARALRAGYKPFKALMLLAGGKRLAALARRRS